MTFEEIFEKEGLYKSDSFAPGFCFKIDKDGVLSGLQYRYENDILPTIEPIVMYKGLFKKEYAKIFTIQSLFK